LTDFCIVKAIIITQQSKAAIMKLKKFKNIVVATDFSESSQSAYRYAQSLATQFGATLEIVHCFNIPITVAHSNYLDLTPSLQDLEATATERLRQFIHHNDPSNGNTLVARRVKTICKAQVGFAPETLIAMSKAPTTDLIILGYSGEHDWIDKLFGSVALRVSQEAHCPVLLVPRGAEYHGLHHIVYAAAFESAHPKEIQLALDFAKYFDSMVHFVHVVTGLHDTRQEIHLFKQLVEEEKTVVRYTVESVRAETAMDGIKSYLNTHATDLLVTVTHHYRFWEKLTHNSTTKNFFWNINMPLLVLQRADVK
jgi:nucleotide-binding universal stress UspA family protein